MLIFAAGQYAQISENLREVVRLRPLASVFKSPDLQLTLLAKQGHKELAGFYGTALGMNIQG